MQTHGTMRRRLSGLRLAINAISILLVTVYVVSDYVRKAAYEDHAMKAAEERRSLAAAVIAVCGVTDVSVSDLLSTRASTDDGLIAAMSDKLCAVSGNILRGR